MKKKPTIFEVLMSTALGLFCLGVWTIIFSLVAILSWTILGIIVYFKTQILTVSLAIVIFCGILFGLCCIYELIKGWFDGKKN
jgi:hypothetical protein